MSEAWGRAMGMAGYRGSAAEKEDRAAGLVVGGRAKWLVDPRPLYGTITEIEIDEDGDPWFHLEFPHHKPVRAEREDIASVRARASGFEHGSEK